MLRSTFGEFHHFALFINLLGALVVFDLLRRRSLDLLYRYKWTHIWGTGRYTL